MGKIQIDTEHARRMADGYSYVIRFFTNTYAAQKKGVKVRPRLGDHMPFSYMRERRAPTFLFCLELKKAAYEISRIIGESITSDQIRGKTLPEIMESNQLIAQRDEYAFEKIVEADETHAVYRHYECVDCHGLPSVRSKIRVYEVGTAASMFSAALGKPCRVAEIKCCVNGNPYYEFLIEVL